MEGIKISVNYVGARVDIAFIKILGYVDTTTCQELSKVIQNLIQQKHYQIIADLGGVTYISSAGWGVFVGEIKNIQDQGGDLKIVQMTPEVFEVFELLEFNRVLNYYDSFEEAINEFDIIRGIDITRVEEGVKQGIENPVVDLQYSKTPVAVKKVKESNVGTYKYEDKISLKDFPVEEKVKMIVTESPFRGIREICKQLNNKKYGFVRIGWFKMRTILKKLNLDTKEKRYRFYRSR